MSSKEEKLRDFETFSDRLGRLVNNLTQEQLSTKLRDDSWTLGQILNHIADAQTMAYYRMKLVYSEDYPVLQPFDQDRWAEYTDSTNENAKASLKMIMGTYIRWANLMKNFKEEDWQRKGKHLELDDQTIDILFDHYYTHGETHLKQIEKIILDNNW